MVQGEAEEKVAGTASPGFSSPAKNADSMLRELGNRPACPSPHVALFLIPFPCRMGRDQACFSSAYPRT